MKGYLLALAVLLACSAVWSEDFGGPESDSEGDKTLVDVRNDSITTTVEVKDGAVMVKSSSGAASAKAGETVVVSGQSVFKTDASGASVMGDFGISKINVNGKTIEVSGDGGNINLSNNNGQITIQCGGVTLTGDETALKSGDKTYDISNSDTVKITVKSGQVVVETKEQK